MKGIGKIHKNVNYQFSYNIKRIYHECEGRIGKIRPEDRRGRGVAVILVMCTKYFAYILAH